MNTLIGILLTAVLFIILYIIRFYPYKNPSRETFTIPNYYLDPVKVAFREMEMDMIDSARNSQYETAKPEPKFFLCRKVKFGNNGNFVRYIPIIEPTVTDLKRYMMQFEGIKRGKSS